MTWPTSTPRNLLSHGQVDYGTSTGADRCEVCQHFIANLAAGPATQGTCEIVEPPIAANGWCDRFLRLVK